MQIVHHFIDGQWVEGRDHVSIASPLDGAIIGTAPVGAANDVERAVRSARLAFSHWSRLSVEERCAHVVRLIDVIRKEYGEAGGLTPLKTCIMREVGKPFPEADLEVLECADFSEYFSGIAPDILAERTVAINSSLWPTKRSIVQRVPIGVVAIIKPWNYPIEMIMWALVPAILAGNTVIVKPSEKSSISAYMLAQLFEAANFPNGVVNFIFGDRETGQAIVHAPEVRLISFTGSVASGRQVAVDASQRLKKVTLELGGNDAAIVAPDVDLELAANGLVWGAFCNAGQVCVGVKRAYIHSSIYEPLKSLIVAKTKLLRKGLDYGPIIDLRQLEVLNDFLADLRRKGNIILTGGEREEPGYFVKPAVIEVINDKTDLLSAECFGPLLPLIEVQSVDEAVEVANNSEYGLGASVWTGDHDFGLVLARRLDVGMVWINDVNVAFPEAPWGGVKNSGMGFELSGDALLEYTHPKHISIESGSEPSRIWWYPYGS